MDVFEEPGTLPYFIRAVKAMRQAQTEFFKSRNDETTRRAKELTARVDAFITDFEAKMKQRQPSLLPKKSTTMSRSNQWRVWEAMGEAPYYLEGADIALIHEAEDLDGAVMAYIENEIPIDDVLEIMAENLETHQLYRVEACREWAIGPIYLLGDMPKTTKGAAV
jgi:hypothetical protein